MNPPELLPPIPPLRFRHAVLLAVITFGCLSVIGVTGFFRLSSETNALQRSLTDSQAGQWNKKIAVHVGWFTTALVRYGVQFAKVPPEARAALGALHGADVGIYKLNQEPGPINSGAVFAAADKALGKRWERIVGVAREGELVAVYLPRKGNSAEHIKCCVMVLHGRDLVVASARGNIEPLLAMAESRLDIPGHIQRLAQR